MSGELKFNFEIHNRKETIENCLTDTDECTSSLLHCCYSVKANSSALLFASKGVMKQGITTKTVRCAVPFPMLLMAKKVLKVRF
jgi:deoxycytidylate deaminase